MENTAEQIAYQQPELRQGTITGQNDLLYRIFAGGETCEGKRAASCLLEPIAGDRVLFFADETGERFILSILERRSGLPASISLEGDLAVKLAGGVFSVEAARGVNLSSAGEISLLSAGLKVQALAGEVVVQNFSFIGDFLQGQVERIKLFARSLDSVLDRLHQRVKRSYRFVEETDQLKAGSIDHKAEGMVHLRGENTVVTAQKLVKIDGEQIHMG